MKAYQLKEIALEHLQKAGYNPRKNLQKSDPEYEALKKSISTYVDLVKAGVFTEVNSWDEYIGTLVNGTAASSVQYGCWCSVA